MNLHPAVFLDRDGVLNEEVGFLSDLAAVRLIPGSASAVARLNAAGYMTVVVTNQSGVARGYFDEAHVLATHELIAELLAAVDARIDRFEYCPFHPDDGVGEYRRDTPCRKPAPGMLLRAAEALQIDLSRSWIVGDRASDIHAGQAAGCRAILVRTGYGAQVPPTECQPEVDCAALSDAVEHILLADKR